MAPVVRILDERTWALRCFYVDLIALLLLLVLLVAMMMDSFYVGYRTFLALQDSSQLFARDAVMYRLVFEALGIGLCFCWLAYRTLRHGYRNLTARP